MNNSALAMNVATLKEPEDLEKVPKLREREQGVARSIEALQEVQKSAAWKVLKAEVFDGIVQTLERELKDESKKDNPDTLKLNRFAGQLKWAEKYSDLSKLENILRVELSRIQTQLHDNE